MQKELFDQLVEKYLAGEASEEESMLLEEYLRRLEKDHSKELPAAEVNRATTAVFRLIRRKMEGRKSIPGLFFRGPWFKLTVAAALVGIFFMVYRPVPAKKDILPSGETASIFRDALPAREGAVLTLGDGRRIILDSATNGSIATLANCEVIKKNGELTFQKAGNQTPYEVVYNTMATPRGHQYPNLVLADGTRVWLDAGSSIRFPSSFIGNERKVEITGQVWFDVTHNDRMPFKVMARGTEIVDLGTTFNISAYDDEKELAVTLLQGAVKIGAVILKPGEQAQVASDGDLRVEPHINLDEVMAWKNGYFSFRNADLKTVMRQLSRWYDVEVSYPENIPELQFNGEIGRNLKLKEVLDGLAFTNVRFKMVEGRKVIILP